MKVRRDRVFEQMDQKETDENVQECVLSREADGFGKNFDEDDSQHIAGTESQEILEILARPLFAHHEIAAQKVTGGCNQAEDGGEDGAKEFSGIHELRGIVYRAGIMK